MIQGTGWNMTLLNLFGLGPKWTFNCDCGETWQARLPMVDCPVIRCPHCGDTQELNICVS